MDGRIDWQAGGAAGSNGKMAVNQWGYQWCKDEVLAGLGSLRALFNSIYSYLIRFHLILLPCVPRGLKGPDPHATQRMLFDCPSHSSTLFFSFLYSFQRLTQITGVSLLVALQLYYWLH